MTPCRCDGRYPGCDHPLPCPTPGGGYRSPYFCVDCDQRRITHITASLDTFLAAVEQDERP